MKIPFYFLFAKNFIMKVCCILSGRFFYIYWHVFLLSINVHFPLYIALTIGEFAILFTMFSLPVPCKGLIHLCPLSCDLLLLCQLWEGLCSCPGKCFGYSFFKRNTAWSRAAAWSREPRLTCSLHEARVTKKLCLFMRQSWLKQPC